MPRLARWLVLAALVLSSRPSNGCHLDDTASLNYCITDILERSRAQLRSSLDPLVLSDLSGHDGFDWHVEGISVHGLADFLIKLLHIDPIGERIHIRFSVTWPSVVGNGKAKLKKCKKMFFKRRCFTIRGRPRITLQNPTASLATTLYIYLKGASMVIIPRGTLISVSLPGIDVDPRLRGFPGFLNKVFGNPARRIATSFSAKFWRKNKVKFEQKIKEELDKLVTGRLAHLLTQKLTGFTG